MFLRKLLMRHAAYVLQMKPAMFRNCADRWHECRACNFEILQQNYNNPWRKCLWSTENWVSCSLIAFSSCYQCRTSICHYYFYLLFVFWIIPSMWNFDGHRGVKITLSLSIIYWRHGWSSVHVYRNCRCLRSIYRTFVCSKGKKVFTRIQVNNRRVQVWPLGTSW